MAVGRMMGSENKTIEGRRIVVGVCGSIAAIRCFDLVRELVRRGAIVDVVMSDAAQGIVHPDAMQYASGRPVVARISGAVEHVKLCGVGGEAELLLIVPATANTISKIACGIDDTTVTTFATTAIGSLKKVVVVPAMHEAMYNHKAVAENLKKLKEVLGVRVIEPRIEEGKAKIAENDEIVLEVERALGSGMLAGKEVVVSAGATEVDIDPVRVLTNKASGRTGLEVALEAYRQGAEVSLIHNLKCCVVPRCIESVRVRTPEEMAAALRKGLKGADVFVSTAAVSDFSVDASKDKISSKEALRFEMKPELKVIDALRKEFPKLFIAGFKAETNVSDAELDKRVRESMEKGKWDMGVGNDVAKSPMGMERNRVVIIGKNAKAKWAEGGKAGIAKAVVEGICGELKPQRT